MSKTLIALTFVLTISIGLCGQTSGEETITPEQLTFFETKIRPVLVRECYGCHSEKAGNVRGGLRLDNKSVSAIGGSSGPAIVPGDLAESLLFNAITHEDFVMPPKRKLSPSIIEDFRQWILMGAPDPRGQNTAEIQSSIDAEDIQHARDHFWAYQSPRRSDPPTVDDADWSRTQIDPFILARLEASALSPAADADALTVLRRLTFDLVGLPPSPQQIRYFTERWDRDPDAAIDHVVDRLMASNQFGERWGRHWLDVVRYAESTGREVNMTFPHAWRYRDFVIDSFNTDKPFDQFVQQHIAGDLMPAKTDDQWAENLVATTFLAMGPKNLNEQNRVQFEADLVDEQIDATTRVFLGMSVACARCHDHKFDAIPQSDYYAMAGLFGNMETYFGNPPSQYGSFSSAQTRRTSSLLLLPIDDPSPFDKRYTADELADLKNEIDQRLDSAPESRRAAAAADGKDAAKLLRERLRRLNELTTLTAKLSVVDENGQPRSYCMGVQQRGQPKNVRRLVRGEVSEPAEVVPRGFPQVLCSTEAAGPLAIDADKSGRLELARWIGSDENALTARVMVNRIWQHMIGRGLVSSTENFGVTGQPPSHPELLDHLALRFVESGWSVKTIVAEIAKSRVYRIASTFDERSHQMDPENALLWRAHRRQLDAEAIRDAMLFVGDQLTSDRPRGSLVAQAGYARVRDGVIGNPRESAQRMVASMRQSGQMSEQIRQRFRNRSDAGSIFQAVAAKVRNQLDMNDANFRSVYLPIVRDEVPRVLEVFDFADASAVSGTREASQTANQALFMLNNPLVLRLSDSFAERVMQRHQTLGERIETAFMIAYGRKPTVEERRASSKFLRLSDYSRTDQSDDELFSAFCQTLFASAEFRFID